MKFSRAWLADHVELPEPAPEIARRLTAAGLAVDAVETMGDDVVFEIDVTTNRPDAMCHRGIARELAAIFDRPLRPLAADPAEAADSAAAAAEVAIDDFDGCPRYVALVIRGVRVGPSPEWLRRRLEAIGHRSISNVVDVTNYVLWETGQPLHAFDLEKLAGPRIVVRRARPGEPLTTLDGVDRVLDPEVLVIADADRAVALGGIMGGLDSEVTAATTTILLESAHFDPRTVRAGAKRLGMHTDASHRFERGADPMGCLAAARRAAALFVEVAGGEVLAGHLEAVRLPERWPPRVEVELARLVAFGGVEIDAVEAERTLGRLGYGLEKLGEGRWRVTPPPWRWYDGEPLYPADVYEEVLRIHGFDAVPSALPRIEGVDRPPAEAHLLRRRLRDGLAAAGFAEAIDFAFHDRAADASLPSLLGDRAPLALANPLSDRYAVMRRSLLPGLALSARFNLNRGARAVRLFELGHVFAAGDGGEAGHVETETLAIVVGGTPGAPWEGATRLDFFDLKGAVEELAEGNLTPRPPLAGGRGGVGEETALAFAPAAFPGLVPGASAEVLAGGARIGVAGELDDPTLPFPLFVAELRTDAFLGARRTVTVQPPSRFPGVAVDTTLTHPLAVAYREIAEAVAEAAVPDLVELRLKDRYSGPGVPDGAVNTTLAFLYQSGERSLTQEEVNERHRALVTDLATRFGVAAEATS